MCKKPFYLFETKFKQIITKDNIKNKTDHGPEQDFKKKLHDSQSP